MATIIPVNKWNELKAKLKGDLYTGDMMRILYATDASAYRELPVAVARPKDETDLKELIRFAKLMKITLIPRTAGTSLAGQVVGNGLVVDVSKYMNDIVEINAAEKWVKVQPGVVLDELNKVLTPYGLFFGPETSTSNRCMIGGMVGNNACGTHSLVYGSTRDHTLELTVLLSDGSKVTFKPLNEVEFNHKCLQQDLEGQIYRQIQHTLTDKENREEIRANYPDPLLKRRNNGYALDLLADTDPFVHNGEPFNYCKVLAGSEGTLAFTTEIKLNLVPLPPKEIALVCIHCLSLDEAFKANLVALAHQPVAVELMDQYIIERTKDNLEQRKNRFFIQGEPAAILVVELDMETKEAMDEAIRLLVADMKSNGYGYHYPVVTGADINKVWALRKAGLGVLTSTPGDKKPVAVIEDTAVLPALLPEYLEEFKAMLQHLGLSCVFYAHISTGELHLRPVLNLKDLTDRELFHTVALETAKLVRKYRGSLSGEHGDGRLRGEFIPLMLGEHVYQLLKELKHTWDPNGIFNTGKITDTPVMNTSLRYEAGQQTRNIDTVFDFSSTMGMLRAVEQCNGSGDCRKSEQFAGTMCPGYRATRNEMDSTRARANILRELLTRSTGKNPFDHQEIYEVMDLCLSCKGCKSECPSNVDIVKYKAEFLQHYYDAHGVPLRSWLIANITSINRLGSLVPWFYNAFVKNVFFANLLKRSIGFATKRSMPLLYKSTLKSWFRKHKDQQPDGRKVYLFADEFSNYNDVVIGIKAIQVLNLLGYKVEIPKHLESGRTFLSKGLVRKAQKIAIRNVELLSPIITANTPLIGIEPSAILTFKDEYIDLTRGEIKKKAITLAASVYLFDEFIMHEVEAGHINRDKFKGYDRHILFHGHCYQKSLASTASVQQMLSLPKGYRVDEIQSGCCGMAGAFGFEKEHYEVSMKVAELSLFPEIRKTDRSTTIAASGTSCRHQIKDGTDRIALHPIEVLWESLQ